MCLSFVVGGVCAMLSSLIYTEFATEIPVAGMRSCIRRAEGESRGGPAQHHACWALTMVSTPMAQAAPSPTYSPAWASSPPSW